jgi:hypothetical protein
VIFDVFSAAVKLAPHSAMVRNGLLGHIHFACGIPVCSVYKFYELFYHSFQKRSARKKATVLTWALTIPSICFIRVSDLYRLLGRSHIILSPNKYYLS